MFCGMAEINNSKKTNRLFIERQVFLNEIIRSKNTVAKYAFRGPSAPGGQGQSLSGGEDTKSHRHLRR